MIQLKPLTGLTAVGLALLVQPALAQTCKKNNITPTTPSVDFTDNGDGTITHKTTGLMWKKCSEGQSGNDCATGTVSAYTWPQALQHANTAVFAGYSDWRLPNIKELASIVELSCRNPAINLTVFPNTVSGFYWPSSPSASHNYNAWGVDFSYGYDNLNNEHYSYRARLVRAR